jgi:hypothetical protein
MDTPAWPVDSERAVDEQTPLWGSHVTAKTAANRRQGKGQCQWDMGGDLDSPSPWRGYNRFATPGGIGRNRVRLTEAILGPSPMARWAIAGAWYELEV